MSVLFNAVIEGAPDANKERPLPNCDQALPLHE